MLWQLANNEIDNLKKELTKTSSFRARKSTSTREDFGNTAIRNPLLSRNCAETVAQFASGVRPQRSTCGNTRV